MAVVGIDLGTTNTVVGIVQKGQATAIRDADGEYLIPSVVSFHPNGTVLVGRTAKERRVVDASNTIYSIKRLIGRSWNSDEVGRARTRFPFEMREGPGQAALVVARGETFTLPEISAFVLRHAKALAEKTLGEPVDRAVITVPANFNDLQRAATKVAGRVAGLEVLRILNEPTAAALAYGYGRSRGERIAIYDFGGGTFDVTLLDLSGNVFEVLATAGNTFLGGDDIDLAIAERMADACQAQHGIDARADGQVFERLRYYAEKLKLELSGTASAVIDVPDVGRSPLGKQIRLSFPLTRGELEELAKISVERTFDVCAEALSIARLSPQDFDQVVLVGGSTRLPIVRARVTEYFGRVPLDRMNPDEVVAIGAAIQANALTGAERRKSLVPRPPMPAARSFEGSAAARLPQGRSQPPPHPHTRKTNPLGKPALPLPMRASAAGTSPAGGSAKTGPTRDAIRQGEVEGRRRLITGMGLGPPNASPEPQRPPPVRKGGTLGGVGAPPGPPLEPATVPMSPWAEDATEDSSPTQRSSQRPPPGIGDRRSTIDTDPAPPVEARLAEADDEPTRVQVSPSIALSPFQSAAPGSADEEITRVGAPPAVLAAARALFGDDFEPDTDVSEQHLGPASYQSDPDDERLPASFLAADDVELDDLEPAPTSRPASPRRPALGFQNTMLGAAVAPVRSATERVTAALPHTFSATIPESRQLGVPEASPGTPVPPLLVDVTPLSLCVETVGGFRDVVITRNTPVPCEQSRAFVTAQHNQQIVVVRVGQGEHGRFADNVVLGELELSGLRPAPRGEAQVVVTFTLDTDGMLEVRARDPQTGNAARARLKLVGLPDHAEVDRMAERHLRHPAP